MATRLRFGAALFAAITALALTAPCRAQDGPESPPASEGPGIQAERLTRLQRGDRAASDGFLVGSALLLDWSFEIRELRRRLVLESELSSARAAVQLEHGERLVLIERERGDALASMWRERANALALEVGSLRGAQPSFWDAPVLWFAIGIIVAGAVAAGLGLLIVGL